MNAIHLSSLSLDWQLLLHYALLYWTITHCVIAVLAGLERSSSDYVTVWYRLPWQYRLLVLLGAPWVLPVVHFYKMIRGDRVRRL